LYYFNISCGIHYCLDKCQLIPVTK
jgi:hypothetical protein